MYDYKEQVMKCTMLCGVMVAFAGLINAGCDRNEDSWAGGEPVAPTPAAAPAPDVTPSQSDTPVVPSSTIWSAYPAPDFFVHGYSGEDTYRTDAIAAARAAGLDALRVDSPVPPYDELAMHLLHMSSPVDGHFMASTWYDVAMANGITRWVIDIGNGAALDQWRFLVKDYPPNTVQFVVNGAAVAQ